MIVIDCERARLKHKAHIVVHPGGCALSRPVTYNVYFRDSTLQAALAGTAAMLRTGAFTSAAAIRPISKNPTTTTKIAARV